MTGFEDWIGREQTRSEIIDAAQAGKLAVTLGRAAPLSGDPLPACWHWAWFNDHVPASELGRDGHPKRGGFLPPVPLPRRMWAGGSLEHVAPVIIGREVVKTSTIRDIREKKGKSGALCIVSIEHVLADDGETCIREIQNLVFREDPKPGEPQQTPPPPPSGAELAEAFTPDPVLMFRYSALTFNGHRIHYDADYARDVEGYPGLVFHAPLTATLLRGLAEKALGKPVKTFGYRATAPLFCNQTFSLCARIEDGKAVAWAETPEGGQAMISTANG